MNKIDFPRKGYDGILRSRKSIERWFLGEVEQEINRELTVIDCEAKWSPAEKACTKLLREHLHLILLAEPRYLKRIRDIILRKYPDLFVRKAKGSFNKRILKAFGYNKFRGDVLIVLAKRLNVKSCPYCNAQYTLFIEERTNMSYPKGVARFQFDHFFNKSDAPFLSMSLYNLIPACASCNLSKHAVDMSMELNPYETDISSLFSFKAKDPIKLWQGVRKVDSTQIQLMPTSSKVSHVVKELNDALFLDKLYGRFGDVAQEIYDKVYLYPYYSNPNNFPMLTMGRYDDVLFKQLWLGNYIEKGDIEKRPLAKFMQDMWDQAFGVMGERDKRGK